MQGNDGQKLVVGISLRRIYFGRPLNQLSKNVDPLLTSMTTSSVTRFESSMMHRGRAGASRDIYDIGFPGMATGRLLLHNMSLFPPLQFRTK